MSPEQLYLRTFMCRVSIPNPLAIAVEWLCQCEAGNYSWRNGELNNLSWMDLSDGNIMINSSASAKSIMRAANGFAPLPEEVYPHGPINNLPNPISRDWAKHVRDFCNYYLMPAGRYKLMITAHLLNTQPNLHQDNTLATVASTGEAALMRWQPHLQDAKRMVTPFCR